MKLPWKKQAKTDDLFVITHDERPALFQLGKFTLSSGQKSNWKIECDALTDEDWETIAKLIGERYKFGGVVGVPTGGLKLAKALQKYRTMRYPVMLVVDDVLTTGDSIVQTIDKVRTDNPRRSYFTFGVVVFARQELLPKDVYALFTLNSKMDEPTDEVNN